MSALRDAYEVTFEEALAEVARLGITPIAGGEDVPPADTPPADTPPADAPPADGGWVATLPAELKDAPAVKKFKGKDWNEVGPQVLKSYVNLEKWQIPGESATPEERAAFHRRLGIPEKVEEYASAIKPEVPEGVPWHDDIQTQFATFAHGEGIPPATATKILNWYLQKAKQGTDVGMTQTADELKKSNEQLQAKWGANWKRNVGLVHRAVEQYGSEAFTEMLESVVVKDADGNAIKLGNHPVMLQFLADYGQQQLEAGFIPGDSLLTTQQDAQAQADKIMDDLKGPYWDAKHPAHKETVKRVTDLLKIAHPDQKRS